MLFIHVKIVLQNEHDMLIYIEINRCTPFPWMIWCVFNNGPTQCPAEWTTHREPWIIPIPWICTHLNGLDCWMNFAHLFFFWAHPNLPMTQVPSLDGPPKEAHNNPCWKILKWTTPCCQKRKTMITTTYCWKTTGQTSKCTKATFFLISFPQTDDSVSVHWAFGFTNPYHEDD